MPFGEISFALDEYSLLFSSESVWWLWLSYLVSFQVHVRYSAEAPHKDMHVKPHTLDRHETGTTGNNIADPIMRLASANLRGAGLRGPSGQPPSRSILIVLRSSLQRKQE